MLDFGSVLKNSKIIYESKDFDDFRPLDSFGDGSLKFFGQGDLNSEDGFDCKETLENQYAIGNNIDYMKFLLEKKHLGSKFNLIYIDPPFFSKASYYASFNLGEGQVKPMAYKDSWEGSREAYLTVLAAQLMLIRDLLSEEGSVFVHLDWHASHYVKILMDEIFGEENFVNEIIWQYKSGGASGKSFARKHDTILFYGKGPKRYFEPQKEKSYNRGLKPYRFKGVEEFEDEIGWYTMVNAKDVWNIDMVGRTSFERTGYATQKPEALLERILLSTTKEGDLVGDFFSGSGVLAAVSKRLNRRFNCCDQGEIAFGALMGRLDFRKPGSVLKVLVQDSCNVGCETDCETGCNVGFETATKEGKIFKNPKVAVSFKVAQGEGFVGDFRYVDYDLDEKAFDPKSLAALKATMAKTPWQLVCFLAVDFGASSQGDGFSYCFNFGSRGMDENFSFDLTGAGGAFDESSDLLEFEQLMDYEKRELGREVRIVIVDIFGNFFDISLKVR